MFKGHWFIFDFNKAFKADLQVVDKHFGNAKRGGLFSKKKFNKVELEDIEFNKTFGHALPEGKRKSHRRYACSAIQLRWHAHHGLRQQSTQQRQHPNRKHM